MTPEEKARQQTDAILSPCGWTVQDKSQMTPHAAEGTPVRQPIEHEWWLGGVEKLSALVTAHLQRATRLRQSVLQRAFEGKLVRL
jgi:hypothetical protein